MEQTVRLSWNAYRSARDRLPNLRQHAESSRLTRDAYVKQFAIGQRSLLDMLDSENEHFTADSNHVNGQFIELFARYRLFADTGKLLDSLAIPHLPESKIDSR
jgi:adhesin transport system outer membrane protein